MISYACRRTDLDGQGGLGYDMVDVLRLTVPQLTFLASRSVGCKMLSSEEAKRKADETYRKDPEAYRRKMQAEIDRARMLTRGKK